LYVFFLSLFCPFFFAGFGQSNDRVSFPAALHFLLLSSFSRLVTLMSIVLGGTYLQSFCLASCDAGRVSIT
jgi:hypothetical protein